MNHVYRLLWNESSQSFIVVSETAKSRGKRSGGSKAAMVLLSAMLAGGALAQPGAVLPGGAQVALGQASISSAGNVMTVKQDSAKAAINWNTFSIGQSGTVNFVQPSAASVVLNRVVGTEKSVIDGALNANGQVFLLNSNGVLFNGSASVNTAGLVASTLGLSDADFSAGRYSFSGNGAKASVINLGNINSNGGYVALLGGEVRNSGTISARLGTVALAAGDRVSLNFNGSSLLNVAVEKGVLDALVENRQAIYADGGQVILTAKAVDALLATVVNNTGVIRARTVAKHQGRIYLLGSLADGGTAVVGGTLDASAPDGGDGGFIETSGTHVRIADQARITTYAPQGKTGTWLIDPNDYTIAASGGDTTGAALAATLNSTNVTIQTTSQGTAGGNGDIFVNDAIAKTGGGATTLTLLAERNIAINEAITSSSGRLNVVLNADADTNSSGNITFGAAGQVETHNGNFVAGKMDGNAVTRQGQNFTMASGSYIDVGMGNLDIDVAGTVSLADASLRAQYSSGWPQSYYNNGSARYNQPNYVNVSSATAILSSDVNPATPNIVASSDVSLSAPWIGGPSNPLRLAGPAGFTASEAFPNASRTLSITNTVGDSYVSEIRDQVFTTVNVAIGAQHNSTQNIQIMGDAGGDGTTGTGHIILHTDGTGKLNLASGDIATGGVAGNHSGASNTWTDPTVFATSVGISATDITFANNAVNTGAQQFYFPSPGTHGGYMYWYNAGFSATASGTLSSAQVDGTADINAYSVSLTAPNIGTLSNPMELGNGYDLTTYNTGGSTYVKAGGYGTLNLSTEKAAGTHSYLFSGGDHINFTTDGNKLAVATIGGASGIDTSASNRSVTLTALSGYVEFDTDSVNVGAGTFTTAIGGSNTDRLSGKAITAAHVKDGQAEITAGNLAFNVYGNGGAISDIEIAKGGSAVNNSLSLTSYGGDIDITELSANHFKNINTTLYGGNLERTVSIDLNGTDNVHFSGDSSGLTLNENSLNLSSGNRNWNFVTNGAVQIDGTALGTGDYTISASGGIRLNSDVLTNGGDISLYGGGFGLKLMRSVRIDSNADDSNHSTATGAAGSIFLNGVLSASAAGQALTVASASSDQGGNSIQLYGGAANGGGAYLGGLTLDAKGSTNTNDGVNNFYGNYLLNGNFLATGNTVLQSSTTIDTEQGNVGAAGNITFAGQNLSTAYWGAQRFDASTTAAGFNGGNVDLGGTFQHGALSSTSFTVVTTGGAGGASGSINLPAMSTTQGQGSGTQSYTGGAITLNGNLSSNGGNIALNGDVRLASNVTIDTWTGSASQNATAGSVTIAGQGVSALAGGTSLSIDTGIDTGATFFNGSQTWGQNGGAVSVKAGNGGGAYLAALNVNTVAQGANNTGSSGALSLNGVATTGAQTYTAGATTIAGNLATNGGNIDLSGAASLGLGSGAIAITTDMAGGTGAAGTLNLGANTLNGAAALSIDTTADGGGAASIVTLNAVGDVTPLAALSVKAKNIVMLGALRSSGDMKLRTTDTAAGFVADHALTSSAGNIVIASAANFVNNVGSALFSTSPGKSWQVWSATPAGDTRNGLVYDFKQYNAQYGSSAVAGSGNGLFYTLAPTIDVTLTGTTARDYDGSRVAALTGANFLQAGAIDGDTVLLGHGVGSYDNANAGVAKNVTVEVGVASASNGSAAVYGYQVAAPTVSAAIGTVNRKTLSVTELQALNRYPNGNTKAVLQGGVLNGLVGTETLKLGNLIGTFDSKEVGEGKTVTVDGLTLLDAGSGATAGLASNYRIGDINPIKADIVAPKIDDIVTTIINNNSVSVFTPSFVPSLVPAARPASLPTQPGFAVTPQMQVAVNAGFGEGSRIEALMAPAAGAPSQRISMEGMQQLLQPNGGGSEAIRVPLSSNSIAGVVNGGVRLPDGVTQEFFIAPAQAQ